MISIASWVAGQKRKAIVACIGLAACGSLVDVETAGVITSDEIDQFADGRILSISARQNFATAYGRFILYGAWFSGEALSAETFPSVAEFDGRNVTADNLDLLTLWTQLSTARESAERVVTGLRRFENARYNIDLARAAVFAGFSYVLMAEYFCAGAASGGPVFDTAEASRRAIAYFDEGGRIADSVSLVGLAADQVEAASLVDAALVGKARAALQNGERTVALDAAQRVRPNFSLDAWYSADPSNIPRLANPLWRATTARATLSIAPAFRQLNDPRVVVVPPSPTMPPLDGTTEFWTQRKHPSNAAPIRLASALEARYLAAEAQDVAAMLALVQERRRTNGQSDYAGPTDVENVTRELMRQRSRDFFLEGKRVGDARRQPGLVPDLRPAGTAYHKAGFPAVGSQSCWPLPTRETQP